jgi:2'-5' RNA ligase
MAFAINLTARGLAGARICELWDEFGVFEPAPSMAALNHPPHITLAIYNSIDEDRLSRAMHQVMDGQPPLQLTFRSIARFDEPGLVFWAAPDVSATLLPMHAKLHQLIDPAFCHEHYRPGSWVPHCTLAFRVTEANLTKAIELANRPIEPFDIVFEIADCVEFTPVRMIDEMVLTGYFAIDQK